MVYTRCSIEEFLTEDKTGHDQHPRAKTSQAKYSQINTGKNLVDLPTELRLMIYSLLPDGRVLQALYPDWHWPMLETYRFDPPDKGLVSLSRSCKAIHHEIHDKLYSSLDISIYASPHPHHPREWETGEIWNALSQLPRHLRKARHIKLEFDLMLSFGPVSVPHDRALAYLQGPKALFSAFRRLGSLKSFGLILTTHRLLRLPESKTKTNAGADSRSLQSLKDQEFARAENLISQLEVALPGGINSGDSEGAES